MWPRLLLPIALAAAVLRASRLFESIWFDELWESHLFLGTAIRTFITIFLDSAHPPLYELFMWAWISVFGDSVLALRSPPFLYGTASVLLVYRFALYYTNVWSALVAAALLAFSPVHIWYSVESGAYASNLFWLLLLALAFEKVREREATSRWMLIYLVSAVVVGVTPSVSVSEALWPVPSMAPAVMV